MLVKTFLAIFSIVCLFHFRPGKKSRFDTTAHPVLQDTLPPVNTLAEENIDTVTERRKTNTIDVKLKTGIVYSYNADALRSAWEGKTGLPPKIQEQVNSWRKTFTKVEHPSTFPGGDEAWDNYVKKYKEDKKAMLKHKGSGTIYVQFIVDTNGELSDVRAFENSNPALAPFAEDVLKKGPYWLPAIQNGYKVVSYQKVMIKF